MTDVASTEHHEVHGAPGSEHHSDLVYIKVAAILAIITALEVAASYAGWLGKAAIWLLLIMMVIKFFTVVLYFMHVKYDAKVFGRLFYTGIFLAVGVYVAFLATFKFFATH
jgi:cytochrome c oxidase subunit 4